VKEVKEKKEDPRHFIKRLWKPFSISTYHMEKNLRANFPTYTGGEYNRYGIRMDFSIKPSPGELIQLETYWNGLNENSEEARKYVSFNDYNNKLKELIDNFDYSKSYAALTINERKLMGNMNLEDARERLSRKDLGLEAP